MSKRSASDASLEDASDASLDDVPVVPATATECDTLVAKIVFKSPFEHNPEKRVTAACCTGTYWAFGFSDGSVCLVGWSDVSGVIDEKGNPYKRWYWPHTGAPIIEITASPCRRYIATAITDGTIVITRVDFGSYEQFTEHARMLCNGGRVRVAWSAGSSQFVSASTSHLHVWEMPEPSKRVILKKKARKVIKLFDNDAPISQVSWDGEEISVTCDCYFIHKTLNEILSYTGRTQYDARNWAKWRIVCQGEEPEFALWSTKLQTHVVGMEDGEVCITTPSSHDGDWSIASIGDGIVPVAAEFYANDRRVLVVYSDRTVAVISPETRRIERVNVVLPAAPLTIVKSQPGVARRIAIVCINAAIVAWDY